MKLIIDIDDEQVLFDIKNRGLESETETDKVIINALYNGIPLDDVKAEIKEKCDLINDSIASELSYPHHREIQELLCEIIASIGKAESEE